MRVKAALLSAGLGTRLKPVTDHRPKCLVPILGRPLLEYWVNQVASAGVRDILVNTHTHAEQVREFISTINQRRGISIREAYEPTLLGSAGTVAANRSFADDADLLLVVYTDNFSTVSLEAFISFHLSHPDPFSMLLYRAPEPRSCGIAECSADGKILSFMEKPQHPRSNLANAGLYLLDASLWRTIADRGAFDLARDIIPALIGSMRGLELAGYHRDIGVVEAYHQACNDAPHILAHSGYDSLGKRPAVFFDRDGTLIEHIVYLDDPDQVRILPDVATAIRRLRLKGFACVVVTNQSAIGRGRLTAERLFEIDSRMCDHLAAQGAVFDALYFCPHVPLTADRSIVEFEDRKPGPGMLWRAASELGLDCSRSYMIGDSISDVLAGQNAGCRESILLLSSECEPAASSGFPVVSNLNAGVDLILSSIHPAN